MTKQKFPGMNNMTIDEVRIMAKVCKNDSCDTRKTWEIINCIDCLTILRSAVILNYRRDNQRRRITAKKGIEARINQARI